VGFLYVLKARQTKPIMFVAKTDSLDIQALIYVI
jgi:hypothetical protein